MTREEIIKHLHEALDYVDIHFPYRYVFVEAIEALSRPSLSNLGEAAEEYSLDVKAKPYGNLVKEAFKGGATWRDAQIPSLPSNLDEAAEEYSNNPYNFGEFVRIEYEFGEPIETIVDDKVFIKDAFKDGAEWQLNEDSKKHFFIQLKNIKDAWQELKKSNPGIENKSAVCFHRGAEWMAGQGETIEKTIGKIDDGTNQIPTYCNGFEITELDVPFLNGNDVGFGDKVIVQIRKKQ